MNFNTFFLKSFRLLLFPFSVLYGCIIIIRNWLFNKKIFKSASFNFPVICVGNLVVGGTGKSPMVEAIVNLLKSHYKIGIISRGYKRRTKGYIIANSHTTSLEIGDEPMQFHLKFPDVAVAVGEERLVAIPQLLHAKPETQVIILDDAFQHRSVQAGCNILLTEYNNLFVHDFFFPTGDLRDQKASYKRAEIIVVTKCAFDLSVEEKNEIIKQINPLPHQHIFFTAIQYGVPYHIIHGEKHTIYEDEVLLVCGIANPAPLEQYLSAHCAAYYLQDYSDHHIYSIADINDMVRKFHKIAATNKCILSTEKDAVRLLKFKDILSSLPFYILPISTVFLFHEEEAFKNLLVQFIQQFPKSEID